MESRLVVVGGGIAGLGAALELGRRGLGVTIVESQGNLGGNGRSWACMATAGCERCGVCLVYDALAEVERTGAITRLVGWKVTGADRNNSALRLALANDSNDSLELTGIEGIVLATGFVPTPSGTGRPWGATGHPSVLTTESMSHLLRRDELGSLPFGALDQARLAVLHCVGSRDPRAGRGYCSQICCGAAIRVSRRLKHLRPGWEITLFHNDLQVYGKEARLGDRHGPLLVHGIPAEILGLGGLTDEIQAGAGSPDAPGLVAGGSRDRAAALKLTYQAPDGRLRTEGFDGALLVVGMAPRPETAALAQALGLTPGPWGFLGSPLGGDHRVVAAGACVAPMGIEASLLSGRAAAARLARAVSPRAQPSQAGSAARKTGLADGAGERPAPRSAASRRRWSRTVAVVGRGVEAAALLEAIREAELPSLWIRAVSPEEVDPVPAGAPLPSDVLGIHKLEGALGDFTLVARTREGLETHVCGAVVLSGDLPWEPPGALPDGPPALVSDRLPPGSAAGPKVPIIVWMDPAGPPDRAVAARLLADAAELQSSGRGDVTLLGKGVSLPGLDAQERYDRARGAGMRVLRCADRAPNAVRQGEAWSLEVTDALCPEVPVRLDVEVLIEAARPKPPAQVASGLGIGLDREGFAPRANVRLAPLRTERAGVYVLGAARQDALQGELADQRQALLAELTTLLGGDPPPLALAAVEIDPGRCIGCLTCVRTCPHHAIHAPPRGTPQVSGEACEACGRCVALCPSLAMRPAGAGPLSQRGAPVDPWDQASHAASLRPPPSPAGHGAGDEAALPCETLAFACRHSGAPALHAAYAEGLLGDLGLRFREVPCVAAVSDLDVLGALHAEARRVLLLGCHPGSCSHVDGDDQCARRMAALKGRLAELGARPDRVVFHTLSPAEPARLGRVLRELLTQGDPS